MSRTPVSEFNARMGLDISPLEQAVPRATALLRKLSSVQAEAFAAQSGGPDMQAMTERMRSASSSPQRLGLGGGGTATFKDPASAQEFTDPIGAAHEQSLKRRALQEANFYKEHEKNVYENMALGSAEAEHLAKVGSVYVQERMRMDAELTSSARKTAQREVAEADAAQEAISQSMQRAAQERVASANEIAAIRRRIAQTQATSRFDLANPFQQQILSVQELNRLLAVRRGLQRGTVEFAQAELAVTQQIARVRGIRDNLTVGAEGMRRLGNTAADNQGRFARFGLGMQQVGYQVQDFAVQIASGTNALTALSQQGSQLLGFFGGMHGAIAGAVLSVGVLAYKLLDTKEATKTAMEQLRSYAKELNKINQSRNERDVARGPISDQVVAAKEALGIAEKTAKLKKSAAEFDFKTQQQAAKTGILQQSRDVFGQNAGSTDLLGVVLAKALGMDALSISTARAVEQAGNLVDAENELTSAQNRQLQVLDQVKSIRDAILNNLDRNREPLVNEQELQSMVALGSITKEQAKQTRLLAEYSKSRSETSLPDNEFAKLDALKHQLDILKKQRLEKTQAFKDTQDEYNATKKGILAIAQAYREQINPKPLVDEKQLRDLVRIEGGLLPSQLAQVKTLAQYSKARSEWSRPDNEFAKLDALQKQLDFLKQQGLEKTDAYKETKKELDSTNKSLDDMAKKYKDQLDPLSEQKKMWKEISQLRDKGKMTPEEATAAQEKILKDINLARKLPDAFSTQGSVLSSGLMVGAASPNQLIDISRQMLKALQNLVSLETTGVKGYAV